MPNSDAKAPIPTATKRISGRRRQFHTEDGANLSDRQVEFGRAIEAYKRKYRRPNPAFSEILNVVDALGYRLIAEPVEP